MKRINLLIIGFTLVCNYTLIGQTTDWWEPDTVTFSDTNKYTIRFVYTYNDNGNVVEFLQERWLSDQWWNQNKNIYTYDAKGNKLTDFLIHWNQSQSQWDTMSSKFWTYDNHNNILTYILIYSANNDIKYVYQYDANNNMTEELYQRRENEENEWENFSLNTYAYDENNNMIYSLLSYWQNNQWDSYQKYVYTYNTSNKLIEISGQRMNNNQWTNNARTTCTYDAADNRLDSTRFVWRDTVWAETYKFISTYDERHNLLTYTTQNNEVNNTKSTHTYDENNDKVSYLYETWNGMNWIPKSLTFYIYDEQNKKIADSSLTQIGTGEWYNDVLFRWEYDENANAVLGINQKWNFLLNDWKNNPLASSSYELYYNNMQSILNESAGFFYKIEASYKKIEKKDEGVILRQVPNIMLYPNPTAGQLTIESAELKIERVEILDILGRVLDNFQFSTLNSQLNIDVSHLASGAYFLKVDNKVVKIIKN